MLRCGFRNPGRFLLAAIVLLSVCVTPSASSSTHAASDNLPAAGSSSTAANDSGLLVCSAAEGGDWTTTSAAFEVIRQCTLKVPEAGSVYLSASAWVGMSNDKQAYKADFRLGLDDSTTGDDGTDRRVSIEPDSGDGQNKSTMVSLLAPIASGQHTFYFLGARDTVSGTVQLHAPSLSVLYFPATSAEIKSCSATKDTWTTDQSTFQEITSCQLSLTESGSVYLTASAGVGLASSGSAYQGAFQLSIDNVPPDATPSDAVRLVDIYPDGSGGSDEVVATALFTPTIAAGPHTFYFSGMLYTGSGPVQVQNASLSVLFFPASNTALKLCGVSNYGLWSSDHDYFTNIRSCNFSVPNRSLAFVEASIWADMTDVGTTNEWEGNFRLGLDDVNGSANTDRQLNVYDSQGSNRVLADSGVFTLMPGDHTFYLAGRRTVGPGIAESWAASLFVLNVPGPKMVYLPLILK